MAIHGYEGLTVDDSPLQTPFYDKLDSEELLDDNMLQSWNWYFTFNKDADFHRRK